MKNLVRLVPDVDQRKLLRALLDHIEIYKIPHKYFYWDFYCSDLWRKLSESNQFKSHNQFTYIMNKYFIEIHEIIVDNLNQPYDIFSLGIGIGDDDVIALDTLVKYIKKSGSKIIPTFVPLDISMHLINYSLTRIQEAVPDLCNYVNIAIMNVDLFELEQYNKQINECSRNPRLYCFLGSTLGNYDEHPLLSQIYRLMNKDDFFLLGVDCPINKWDSTQIKERYSEADEGFKFLLGPLRSVGKYQNLTFNQLKQNIRSLFYDPSPKHYIRQAKHIHHELQLENGNKIMLNKSTKYDLHGLLKFLEDYFSLKTRHIVVPNKMDDECPGSYYTLLLLQKLEEKLKPEGIIKADEQSNSEMLVNAIKSLCEIIKKKSEESGFEDKDSIKDELAKLANLVSESPRSINQLQGIMKELRSQKGGRPTAKKLSRIIKEYFVEG